MRAQITIFIILGAMILLAIGVGLTMVKTTDQEQALTADLGVKGYVEQCIRDLGSEAIRKLGQHGGYIDPNDPDLAGIDLARANPLTDGDLVTVGKTDVALWLLQGSPEPCSTCLISSNQPTLTDMEIQLEIYVEALLDTCTQNFQAFKDEGFLVTAGSKESKVEIGKKSVIITMDYPVTLSRGVETSSSKDYAVDIPANILSPYLLASQITAYQFTNFFLEDVALHLISAYSGTPDSARIPPISYFEEGFGSKTWTQPKVEERIRKHLLGRNIPRIEIQRTKGVPKTEDSVFSKAISEIEYKDEEVRFFYDPKWKIYFDVRPTEGILLRPNTHTQKYFLNLVPATKYNFYEFFYTFSFPVVVRIEETESFDGDGFIFQFALEANVIDNKNFLNFHIGQGTIGPFPDDQIDVTGTIDGKQNVDCTPDGSQFKCAINGISYASEIDCGQECVKDTPDEPIDLSGEALRFCDSDQRISEPFDFVVKDRLRKTEGIRNPIEGASVTMGCGNYKECVLGGTDNSGILNSPVPFCLGTAYALAQADEYQAKVIHFRDAIPDAPQTITFLMEPVIKKQIRVKLIRLSNLFHTKDVMVNHASQLITYIGIVERIINQSAPTLTPTGPVGGEFTPDVWAELLARFDGFAAPLRQLIQRHKKVKRYQVMDQALVRLDSKRLLEQAEQLTLEELLTMYQSIVPGGDILTGVLDDAPAKAIITDMKRRRKNINLLTPGELGNSGEVERQRNRAILVPDDIQVVGTLNKLKEQNDQAAPAGGIDQKGNALSQGYFIFGAYESRLQVLMSGKKLRLRTIASAPSTDYEDGPIGGIEYVGVRAFSITDEMLLSDKPLIMYAFIFDDYQTIEDLAMLGEVESHSQRLSEFIEPELAN